MINISATSRKHYYFLVLLLATLCHPVYSYNLRKITNMENLSNNSVTSLCQDKKGNLWIGTCDGLNMYNGYKVSPYQSANPDQALSGTLIDKITNTENHTLWLQTYYGVDKFNMQQQSIEKYSSFTKRLFTEKDNRNYFYIIQKDSCIFINNPSDDSFTQQPVPNLVFNNILSFFIDTNNIIRIINKDGTSLNYGTQTNNEGNIVLNAVKGYQHTSSISYAFSNEDGSLFIDNIYNLYEYNTEKQKVNFVINIKELCAGNGSISSVIKFHDDYFIGFTTDGLYRLKSNIYGYTTEKIQINSGVFCLLKDRFQNIVWIGTDGQGVYSYFNDTYSIRSTLFSSFTSRINRPVRAIYKDKENTLWLGSKGDGITKVFNHNVDKNISDCKTEQITVNNSVLWDNAVYSFAESQKKILWIGTEEGLNYYSSTEKQVKRAMLIDQDTPVKYIHHIYEQDSVLWVASVGMGIIKAKINWQGNTPVLKVIKRFLINDGDISSNYFFSFFVDGEKLWIANRGSGVFILNTRTDELENITFNTNTLNEIYSITKDSENNYLIGTSAGLIKYRSKSDYKIINNFFGFSSNIIHCILAEENDTFWLSTNNGVVNYNSKDDSFRKYNHLDGLEVFEFADGACFSENHCLYFGGTNGFLSIIENTDYRANEYTPPIYFTGLTIFGQEHIISDYLSVQNNIEVLTLNHNQNFFSITFNAIDFLNGGNYNYQYKFTQISSQWVNNGNSGSISLTNFTPGEYTLLVKYHNMAIGKESPVHQIQIKILPPWYKTTLAYTFYWLLVVCLVALGVRFIVIREKKKKVKALRIIEQKHKEDVYESKLRFFTNIAHEFCTPLTLIYGPCNRILSLKNTDKSVVKYTQIIQQNAERLNQLIQDLIEFRRIETGHKNICVEKIEISKLIEYIKNAFTHLAESRNIQMECYASPDISWNSDKEFLTTIITNLLSNAFKYTPNNGNIYINVEKNEKEMRIIVSNSGKGIRQEDISKIFDRYTVLENFENQEQSNLSSRNGLGLAISNNMVGLLGGKIEIKSTLNEYTHFIVKLPFVHNEQSEQREIKAQTFPDIKHIISETKDTIVPSSINEIKPTLLIIDDEPEILWLIRDIFNDDFNVITAENTTNAFGFLKDIYPDIIICDIMMTTMDGITFTKHIKNNPETAHIPLVLISAKHEMEKQIEGMDAGAELYITKPFNTEFLKTSVKQLLSRRKTLKDYFASPKSAYDLNNGKLKHKEHKKLIKEILDIINKNIQNKDLNVDFIANEMNISSRSLYRKMKEISDKSIADMIRDCRLHITKDLLTKSKLTVDEIAFKSGFANKVSFYKAFAKVYGCTPGEYREQNKF
ncbi:two-component regulator propeller domain-containing protein [Bacteroides sp. 519]|uniref:hybrid sensor histidine kinase/response regulator transcription factor n=1 Tax=Bacteroides sp. 519 TaxID=2302937 RepID=UPI0013D5357D|nr:two-component regulator propeller domain-containing protein [Bacteroides sp. 519]NDV59921.1 response regulator [Bacteroides sp. 519]